MATDTKTIKQKMKSVKNIGKITKAMEMISVSKMKKSVSKRAASALFAKHSLALLETLSVERHLSHPYLESRPGSKILLLVIASNKGLCGGYNMNVSKQVTSFIKDHSDMSIEVCAIGKQAEKIALRNQLKIVASFTHLNDELSDTDLRSVLQTIFELYETDTDYASVSVAYTEFISSLAFAAQTMSVIPLSLELGKQALGEEDTRDLVQELKVQYAFEPSEQEVLDVVVPSLITTIIYQRLLESFASEHSSRVTAMHSASDNAGEMLEELNINYNRARQAGITQEIAEIVGGSSAMQ